MVMRKVTLIRFGVTAALATIGIAGLGVIGCSGDDDDQGQPKPDSGTDATKDTGPLPDTGPTPDTGPGTDGGSDGEAGAPKDVKLVIVHASPGLGPFRMCFGTGAAGTVAPLNALPDTLSSPSLPFPGVYPNTGGPLPKFPIDPSKLVITPYIVFAEKVAGQTPTTDGGEKTCIDLLGATGAGGILQPNVDFLKLPAIPAGTFTPGHTYLLSVVGCLPGAADPSASVAKCGGDWVTATGNIGVGIGTLDNTTPASGMGVQFAHRSSAIQGLLGNPSPAANGLVFGFIGPAPAVDAGPADASDDADTDAAPPPPTLVVYPLTSTTTPPQYSPKDIVPATATPVPGLDKDKTPFGVFFPSPDGGVPPLSNKLIALPLNIISQLSTGVTPTSLGGDGGATIFVDGKSYVFVLVGTPPPAPQLGQDGGIITGMRLIAFPTDPVVPSL